jgi:hypothetical protein
MDLKLIGYKGVDLFDLQQGPGSGCSCNRNTSLCDSVTITVQYLCGSCSTAEVSNNVGFVTTFLEFIFHVIIILFIVIATCKWHFLSKLVVRSTG